MQKRIVTYPIETFRLKYIKKRPK